MYAGVALGAALVVKARAALEPLDAHEPGDAGEVDASVVHGLQQRKRRHPQECGLLSGGHVRCRVASCAEDLRFS